MLEIHAEAAHGELKPQPMDFAFRPRDYQRQAVQTVEVHLALSRMMDLGAISIGRSTPRTKDTAGTSGLTRHRSSKKVVVPDGLTQPLGGTNISLERKGMGLVECFLETYGRPESICHTVRYAIPARSKCDNGRRQLLNLQQKREAS